MGKSPPNADGAADPSALVIDSVANNNAAPIRPSLLERYFQRVNSIRLSSATAVNSITGGEKQ